MPSRRAALAAALCAGAGAAAAGGVPYERGNLTLAARGWRLIEHAKHHVEWLPPDEVERLIFAKKECSFADVTDFPEPTLFAGRPPRIPHGPTHQAYVRSVIPLLTEAFMTEKIDRYSEFHTRYYTTDTGAEALKWLAEEFRGAACASCQVREVAHPQWPQISVIATIPGTGPRSDEVVIMGGHADSIAGLLTPGTTQAPGADDDASGSITALQLFKALGETGFRPDRTVEFHAYAAEEVGLRGSQEIAQQYAAEGRRVAGMIQLDMTGYTAASPAGPVVGVIDDQYTESSLSRLAVACADEYCTVPGALTGPLGARSDHASWNRAGYAATCGHEALLAGSNPLIHTSGDVLSAMNITHAVEVAKMTLGVVAAMACPEGGRRSCSSA